MGQTLATTAGANNPNSQTQGATANQAMRQIVLVQGADQVPSAAIAQQFNTMKTKKHKSKLTIGGTIIKTKSQLALAEAAQHSISAQQADFPHYHQTSHVPDQLSQSRSHDDSDEEEVANTSSSKSSNRSGKLSQKLSNQFKDKKKQLKSNKKQKILGQAGINSNRGDESKVKSSRITGRNKNVIASSGSIGQTVKVHHHYHHHVHHHLGQKPDLLMAAQGLPQNMKTVILNPPITSSGILQYDHSAINRILLQSNASVDKIGKHQITSKQHDAHLRGKDNMAYSNFSKNNPSANMHPVIKSQAKQPTSHVSVPVTHKLDDSKHLYESSQSPIRSLEGKIKIVHVYYLQRSDSPTQLYKRAKISIQWRDEPESCNTCGWLLSEFIRRSEPAQLYNTGEEQAPISDYTTIALKSKDSQHITLDSYLTQVERSLSIIPNNIELEAVQVKNEEIKSLQNLGQECLDLYIIEKVIGKGGFSKVLLVRHKISGLLYAMKVMRKDKIKRDNKVLQIMTERRILEQIQESGSPFIISMHSAFQSTHYLHFVLDFCAGGELFYLITKYRRFPEPIAKFYFVEIMLGLEHLHSLNIMYRDLKPENILLDLDGHVRVTDFGLSRDNFSKRERALSFCGSPEYMSPDMLALENHTRMVDFYSLGALLYEMLTGLPPFYSNNRDEMYHNIVNKELTYPRYLSNEAVKLLKGLLCKDPSRRLGSTDGFAEVKRSDFCAGIDWALLYKKKIRNMPPQKMNPSSTPESLLTEFFDPEYTKSEPRLSLFEEARTTTNMLKRSKSESAKNKLGPLEFYKPLHIQIQEEGESNNPFSSNLSRQTGSAQRLDPQTTRAKEAKKSKGPRDFQNQSPTFKNFQYSIFKKKKDQQNFSNFKKNFKPGEVRNNPLIMRKADPNQLSIRKGNKQLVAELVESKFEHQEEQPLRNNTDDSFSGSETRRQDHQNTEKCPIFIYRSANNNEGVSSSNREELKVVSSDKSEFERDSQEVRLYSRRDSSVHEFKMMDEGVIIETAQSQKHQNPTLERLKLSKQSSLVHEDHSEIVLDLREESAALSNTFVGGHGPAILSDPQSPQNQVQQALKQNMRVKNYEIAIPPLPEDFEGQSSSQTNILNIVINPAKEVLHTINSVGRTAHSLTPQRQQSEHLINTQIQTLFDHFMYKTKQEKPGIFQRKQAIIEQNSRIQSSPVNTFLGIQQSYNNQLMVLGDQDSKVISPQGVSPRSGRKQRSPTAVEVIGQAMLQGSIFRNQNMLLKRRYGEVVGNVVQERKRRNPSRANSGVNSFLKVSTISNQRKSGINLGSTTRAPNQPIIEKPSIEPLPQSNIGFEERKHARNHASPSFQGKSFNRQKSPQNPLQKQASKGALQNPKQMQPYPPPQKRDAKVYAEYFMQFGKDQPQKHASGSSTDRSAKKTEKSKVTKQSLSIFSPLQIPHDIIHESNPYLYQQNFHSRKNINSKSRSKSNEKLGFFRSFDAQTDRGDKQLKGSILQKYTKGDNQLKTITTPSKGKNQLLFKNVEENYQVKRSQLEPQTMLKHNNDASSQSSASFAQQQLQTESNFILYTARNHHQPMITQKDEGNSHVVQNTEPIPYNSSGINYSSPYLMGMQQPLLESSVGNKIKNFIIESASSPRNVALMPPLYVDLKDGRVNEIFDQNEDEDSVSDISQPRATLSNKEFVSQAIQKPPKFEDPLHLKKLIEDRKKEIREKIMQPARIGNLKQSKPSQSKVQKKIRTMLEGSPQRKLPGAVPIQSSVKRYTGLGGSLKVSQQPQVANVSILDNQVDSKRQSEASQAKSPLTLSVSLKGPSKNETISVGSVSGSFLAVQQTGQYNILNEILMSQHQPKSSQTQHQRVVTQHQLHVTVSKPGALSSASRIHGMVKQGKGVNNLSALGSSFSSSAANHMASIPATTAIKATPNRSTNQSNITRPAPLHKKL